MHKSPGNHNVAILEKLTASEDRIRYAKATIQDGWSRNVLGAPDEAWRMRRQGKAVANFDRTLPAPNPASHETLRKTPYSFGLLTFGDDAQERGLERGYSITFGNLPSNWASASPFSEADIAYPAPGLAIGPDGSRGTAQITEEVTPASPARPSRSFKSLLATAPVLIRKIAETLNQNDYRLKAGSRVPGRWI